MKRVCIVRINYYPDEPHLRRDAETLVEHGYDVDVICLRRKKQKSREVIRGVNVYRLPLERHRKGAFRFAFEYVSFFVMAFLCLTFLSLQSRYSVIQVINMPDSLVF